jgi:hypothetical protein
MWTYQQSTGKLTDADGILAATGYSGTGEGKDNGAFQQVHDVGPIPQGLWTIGAPYTDPEKGPIVMALTPSPSTDTFGRSAFLIHGDSITSPGDASKGCIVLSRAARMAIASSNDLLLQVTA